MAFSKRNSLMFVLALFLESSGALAFSSQPRFVRSVPVTLGVDVDSQRPIYRTGMGMACPEAVKMTLGDLLVRNYLDEINRVLNVLEDREVSLDLSVRRLPGVGGQSGSFLPIVSFRVRHRNSRNIPGEVRLTARMLNSFPDEDRVFANHCVGAREEMIRQFRQTFTPMIAELRGFMAASMMAESLEVFSPQGQRAVLSALTENPDSAASKGLAQFADFNCTGRNSRIGSCAVLVEENVATASASSDSR